MHLFLTCKYKLESKSNQDFSGTSNSKAFSEGVMNLSQCTIHIDSVRRDRRFGVGNLSTNENPINIYCTYTINTTSHISRNNHFEQMALVTYWGRTSRTES